MVSCSLAATMRSSSFWIAALPMHGAASHRPTLSMTASSAYMASAPATSPRLMASAWRCRSAAGLTFASTPVAATSVRVDASTVTRKKDFCIVSLLLRSLSSPCVFSLMSPDVGWRYAPVYNGCQEKYLLSGVLSQKRVKHYGTVLAVLGD